MAHGYRTLQHWNQWLSQQFLGQQLLEAEKQLLTPLLNNHFGKHALLIGVPQQFDLLNSSIAPRHYLASPLNNNEKNCSGIESDLHELPFLTGSIDTVILPHTLEHVDHPRHLLTEACRITKPEGLIVICGFNPYSAWGLKKRWEKNKGSPWSNHFIHAKKIKKWLQFADFQIEQQKPLLFRPPINNQTIYEKIHFLEPIGRICFPFFAGSYILLARAKVIPLTPIRLKWKQHLSGIRIPTTITGHIARHSNP